MELPYCFVVKVNSVAFLIEKQAVAISIPALSANG
jgi:hypothetical protein